MYEDTGYASYQDPRLQPPMEEESADKIAFDSCRRAGFCAAMVDGCSKGAWEVLGCEECSDWRLRK
jgi:hypothetical protein